MKRKQGRIRGVMIYLARADGAVIGKFAEDDLRTRIASGDVSPSDLYLSEGAREWKPLRELPGAGFPDSFPVSPSLPINPTRGKMEHSTKLFLALGVVLGFAMLGSFVNSLNTHSRKKPVVSIEERKAIAAQADAEEAEKDATASRGQIERGMNKEQCKMAWGEPTSVKRFRTGAGIEEIWIYQYGLHHGFMLTFKNGVLKDVRSPHSD